MTEVVIPMLGLVAILVALVVTGNLMKLRWVAYVACLALLPIAADKFVLATEECDADASDCLVGLGAFAMGVSTFLGVLLVTVIVEYRVRKREASG